MSNKKLFEVQITEVYKANVTVLAESKDKAISLTKAMYETGAIEIDSEDIVNTEYKII